ncbi:MAG: hydantoinase/oxoprolinase family protein [Thaumarchaeota archaeon]|nr:hydantoinase/oxoprolinase family protein [Nitrososphaerota archaeon]
MESRPVSIGVDVGGTFTDVVSFDARTGLISVLKLLTSKDPSTAIASGVKKVHRDPKEVSLLVHATTLATNALLTRTGLGRAALVTNEGFRDILEIARQRRPELYNLDTRRPEPLIPRSDRFTVGCRIGSDGRELEPLDPQESRSVCRRIAAGGYESVAVSFLNSYLNPTHERKMAKALRSAGFEGNLCISSEIDNEYREYERTSTTAVNAVLAPMMAVYVRDLVAGLRRARLTAPVYLMNSDGGAATPSFASSRPVFGIESGPAAGVVASSRLARQLSADRVLTFDMGGTTAKAGAVIDGQPDVTREFEAAGRTHSGRSIRGSGYAVRGSFIDLAEVSAGGGTVAWADESGDLNVGPRSAGSEPGPACYARGGTEPTVTDANVYLGRLSPESLLGGAMRIRRDLATRSLAALSRKLGTSLHATSTGILRIVNHGMARAISIVSVERGRDPRDYVLFAFGGAGPAHACDLAEDLGVRTVVVPSHAGLFSAFGLLAGDLTRTFTAPVMKSGAPLSPLFRELEESASKEMAREGFQSYTSARYFEARYEGQSHELLLPFNGDSSLGRTFDARHRALYDYSTRDRVEVVNIQVRTKADLHGPRTLRSSFEAKARATRRRAWIGGRSYLVEAFAREAMRRGERGSGPCIIEEYDSTLVVNPGWKWRVEEYGTRFTR